MLLFGLWYRTKALASFVHPTYGNTMYHTGMIRLIAETGFMPIYDLSYGGFTKSFYVPAYRLFVGALSVFSNMDAATAAGLAVIFFGMVAIIAAYLLGKELGGEWAGVFTALLFVISSELTIYTLRSFPEVLGIPLFLLTLYFLQKGYLRLTVLTAVLTTLSHQTTAVALGAVLLLHAIVNRNKTSALALIASVLAYFSWQLYALGSLDVMSMQQIAHKESGVIGYDNIERIGAFALMFAPIGLIRVIKDRKILLLSFAFATLLLAKNELFGIGIFTDRLYTFFALSVLVFGGIGMAEIKKALKGAKWK